MMMQAKARIKYLRMSPKKVRHVARLVKGKPVQQALDILNFLPKAAARPLAKTLKSAAANAISSVGTARLKAEDLSIASIMVDAAPTMKRIRFQSMGRIFRVRKRMCHVTIEVQGEPQKEETRASRRAKAAKSEDKGAKATAKKGRGKKAVEENIEEKKVSSATAEETVVETQEGTDSAEKE